MKHTNKLWTLLLAVIALVALCAFAASAEEIVGGECGWQGNNLTWSYDTESKVLTITGTGDMANYDEDFRPPWYEYSSSVAALTFSSGITSIGSSAFADCSLITELSIPEGVTSIGRGAFENCYELRRISMPNSLRVIKGDAFSHCIQLKYIDLPEGLETIGIGAFGSNWALSEITIPSTVTTAASVFAGDNVLDLEKITLAEGLKMVDVTMFAYTRVRNVVIPNSVESIGALALSMICTNIKTVRIGNGLKEIGYAAMNADLANALMGEDFNSVIETVYTCMTEEEWNQNVTARTYLTDEEIEVFGEYLPGSVPETSWKAHDTQVVYNYHTTGEPVEEFVPATCTTPSSLDSVTYCTLCHKELSRETIEVLGPAAHQYTATWIWSDNGLTADAVIACTKCDATSEVLSATVTQEEQSDGSILCTATIVYEGVTYQDTKIIEFLPITEHHFTVTWTWSDDGTLAIAEGVCSHCDETFLLRPTITRETQSDGKILCTASVEYDNTTYTDTKTVQPTQIIQVKPGTFRCSMCKTYEAYKGKGAVGTIITILHFIVHTFSKLASK